MTICQHPLVEKHIPAILDMEDWLWKNPESGYREWKTHAYLAGAYRALGYTLAEAGDIPGFVTDIDTGRPGPKVLVFGEMDSLIVPDHPDADPVTGAVHACGHCAQSAALYGIALALTEPGALDGLCGSIRLAAVPAEELIETAWREEMRAAGKIKYFGGKGEFLRRGLLDGCDMAIMAHTSGGEDVGGMKGGNGCLSKRVTYIGRGAHASVPYAGINALQAASLGIAACNALRETFRDADHIRYHPILTHGGNVVNAVPDRATLETYVRGASMAAIAEANRNMNRALAASAAAIGARVQIHDRPGYAPIEYDPNLLRLLADARAKLLPDAAPRAYDGWDMGCTDLGDISQVMPVLQATCGGAEGCGHGSDYRIPNPTLACAGSASLQLYLLDSLLRDNAREARKVVSDSAPAYAKDAYLSALDAQTRDIEAVSYAGGNTATLVY